MTERLRRWTLTLATTTYTVELPEHGDWLELHAWGPAGVEDGPSGLRNTGRHHYYTDIDLAPVEYAPFGQRVSTGADLVAGRVGAERESYWRFDGEVGAATGAELGLAFRDDVTGLRAVLRYAVEPDQDVLLRWVEISNSGETDLRLERFDSAGVCVPTGRDGALLTFLTGAWSHEFQRRQITLPAGRFEIGSTQGVAGHACAPWLAVQDAAEPDGPAWGVSLVWPGSWRIDADIEPSGVTRVRAGRQPHEGAVLLAPGETLSTPKAALAYGEGLAGLAHTWHRYERYLSGERLTTRPVLYNSWEATAFTVKEGSQLELAAIAAELGAELFVVDDGWFLGRHDDTGGLGDWHPDPALFPDGFGAFVEKVRALGLDFGLWVEPECVNPGTALLTEHSDWVYHLDGRPPALIRNQLLLDLGREDVYEFIVSTLDRLLTDHPISYLKWDMNRPPTERGRPGGGDPERLDLDGAHASNYLRVLDHLRATHPHVLVEGCASGGGRIELATIARTDVVWTSDNTGPLDRLAIQHGFLHAHAPHVMSSWVTDSPGFYDTSARSARFRFVTAMAGVLGIGADIRAWTPEQRAEAAGFVARYKEIRDVVQFGDVHLHGAPTDPTYAVQYVARDGDRVVVLAWRTGVLAGPPAVVGRPDRLRLRGLDPAAVYVDADSGTRYRGAALAHGGLPVTLTRERDADIVVLDRATGR